MPTPNPRAWSPTIMVQVTDEIIKRSEVRDSSHCMIAEALQLAVPRATYVSVDLATIRFTDRVAGRRYIYLTPRSAQAALLAFDHGEPTEPFKFRLYNAHVLATGTARQRGGGARLEQPDQTNSTSGAIPVRVGGLAPPIAPLAAGADGGSTKRRGAVRGGSLGPEQMTGRRREFGLRAIIR